MRKGLLVPVGVTYEALQQTGSTAEKRGRKGGRADLTHKDWSALKQEQTSVTRWETDDREEQLTLKDGGPRAGSPTCRGCGAELICGGGGVAKTRDVGWPGP